MSDYPKIYSISTVGIRQHGNTDFLFHSLRTDFTGNNGLGKSLIADLLQLIFVPLRDVWKPGTEGLDEKERKIETIPLDREWITHAYCFVNIEISYGNFLTIGVFIPRNSRYSVRPFIIQRGDNFEDTKIFLKPFEHKLAANDFVAESFKIYELKELQRYLFDTYSLHLKVFHQRNEINDYFNLLYKNQILHIDLTKENNLKSFAKVLQSFSKAKTLKITDSKSLQNFLFEDDDEIRATFENQKDNLNRYIREYHRADQDIKLLEKKQGELGKLRDTFDLYENAKKNFLLKSANLYFKRKSEAEKDYNDNETTKTNSFTEYEKAKQIYETQCNMLYARMLEQKAICNEIRNYLEKEQSEIGTFDVEKLKKQFQCESAFIERLNNLQPFVEIHKSIAIIKEKFEKQENIKEKKKKLEALQNNPYFEKFEKSKWIYGYDTAFQYYNDRNTILKTEITTIKELLSLYDGDNPDSFFNWAVNQNSALSIEQETILMSFKDIYTKQIALSKGKKYSLSPQSLINSFEKEGNGVWVILGDLREYFPLIEKQIFNDKNKLGQALANNKEQIENEIRKNEIEQTEIKNLNNALVKIGLNQDLIDIYSNRDQIENYQLDILLTEDNVKFIEQNFSHFYQIENLQKQVDTLMKKIENSGAIKSNLDANKEYLDEILESIAELKKEISNPVVTEMQNWQSYTNEEFMTKRKEYKTIIKKLEKESDTTKSMRDTQKTKYDNANNQTITLSVTMENAEKEFATAKQKFEKETFLNFDEQLQMCELNVEIVELAKTRFEEQQQIYWQEYTAVANAFDESKSEKKNPELYDSEGKSKYNYQTLENVLCGKIGLSGLSSKLGELNEQLKTFGELQMKILTDVFGLVEKQYKDFEKTIIQLNFFFKEQKVNDIYQFKVEFEPRKDINIDWIEKMKEKGKVHRYGADLFTLHENMPSVENTPENLIKNIAKQFYSRVSADTSQLLNPKFYFTLKVSMEDEVGKKNIGSGGQTYTALALLCIGRLSIVQKDKRQGVKFIIIEELSNIDDTNFSIFPEIARQFGYQLITMTPKPFGSYTNDEWYLHMLVKGKENKDENYIPMSWFKTKSTKKDLNTYLHQQNELETV